MPFYATVSVHPYWAHPPLIGAGLTLKKLGPLMVFWNLSLWALNGAENWIVPKDCWRRKKTSVGAFLPRGSLLTNHRECINTPFTKLALRSLDNGLDPMSVAPNFIWKIGQKSNSRTGVLKFQFRQFLGSKGLHKLQFNEWGPFLGTVGKTHCVCLFLARSLYQSINAK